MKFENGKLILRHQPSGGKTWVAEILGPHPKYGFERSFLSPIHRERSSSGRTGSNIYLLAEGKIYQVQEPFEDRVTIRVQDGDVVEVNPVDLLKELEEAEA